MTARAIIPAARPPAPSASATPIATANQIRRTIFPLTLRKTYLEEGFFNVTVDFDKYVRPDDGPVVIFLVVGGREHRVDGKVNRSTANRNGTARVRGGAPLKDLFLSNFDVDEQLDVQIESPTQMRIQKARR